MTEFLRELRFWMPHLAFSTIIMVWSTHGQGAFSVLFIVLAFLVYLAVGLLNEG